MDKLAEGKDQIKSTREPKLSRTANPKKMEKERELPEMVLPERQEAITTKKKKQRNYQSSGYAPTVLSEKGVCSRISRKILIENFWC